MPIHVAWDPEQQIWSVTTAESFTFDEVAEVVEKSDWHNAERYLWDLRDLTEGPVSSDDIRRAASLVDASEPFWTGSRVAIVVARDLDYGIARMFQSYAEAISVNYQIFRDHEEAVAWLVAEPTD